MNDLYPPVEPEMEQVVHENLSFAETCLVMVRRIPPSNNWILGKPLTTSSEKWGLVWRVDFKRVNRVSRLINRVICWRTLDGKTGIVVASEQEVPPLHE